MTSNIGKRLFYLCLAYGSVGLGLAGIVLPLLPATPFLLLAAWAAPKGSSRLDHWLRHHPRFGPDLQTWREVRAVPAKSKRLACALLLVSWLILLATASSAVVPSVTAILFSIVASYVCTRPLPMKARSPQQ